MSILANVDDKRHYKVREEQAFGLCTDEKLYSLDDLSEAINLIEPETFTFHVNEHKNDFASWVDGVFGEHELAAQLREHPTPLRMMVSIEKFLRMHSTPQGASQTSSPETPSNDSEPQASAA